MVEYRELFTRASRIVNHRISVKACAGVVLLAALALVFALRTWGVPPDAAVHETSLGIQELVDKVAAELDQIEIDRRAAGTEPIFKIDNFDLEIAFVVNTVAKTNGEFKYQVVTLGSETESKHENVHRLTLHLSTIPKQDFTINSSSDHIDITGADVEVLPTSKKGNVKP